MSNEKIISLPSLEKDIQEAVLQYLDLNKKKKGYLFWRNNNVSVFDSKTGSYRRFPKWCLKGVPDIHLIWNGQYVGLEIKRPGGKQSEDQKEFQRLIKEVGAEYHLITSVDQLPKLGF